MAIQHWNPADQLQNELRNSVLRGLRSRRPIITHLNADTTWLTQLPNPHRPRKLFNILIDPWLSGPQSDVASWFSTQWHAVASSVQTIHELEGLLREIESLAQEAGTHSSQESVSISDSDSSLIDLVVISHEFTDHCHQATLVEIDPLVPVVATDKAASLIKSWNHFNTVITTPTFGPENNNWRESSIRPLPPWLGVSRITSPGNALYYHSAILISFEKAGKIVDDAANDSAEAIIYTPHGVQANDLSSLAQADPRVETLALMHGLHDVAMTSRFQLNLGAHNGLKAQRICDAKYWVATHDEVKKGGGLIAPFLRRAVLTVEDAFGALDQEITEANSGGVSRRADVNFAELGNGESILLL